MARELGLNPSKLGKLANHRQEPWKAPLPQFIESRYLKRFGRERPQVVVTVEQHGRAAARQKPPVAQKPPAQGASGLGRAGRAPAFGREAGADGRQS